MPRDDFDIKVKLAIYEITSETGDIPNSSAVSRKIDADEPDVIAAFSRLHAKKLLLPEPGDPGRIRMAPPFWVYRLRFRSRETESGTTPTAFGMPMESPPRWIAMQLVALRMVIAVNR